MLIVRVYRCRNCGITLALKIPDGEEHKLSWNQQFATDAGGSLTECPKCFQHGSLYPLEELSP